MLVPRIPFAKLSVGIVYGLVEWGFYARGEINPYQYNHKIVVGRFNI